MNFPEYVFVAYLVLLILFFSLALVKYNRKSHKLKWKANVQLITIFVYSIGTSLLVFGIIGLVLIFTSYFFGTKINSFEVYSLLATTITSTGLSITIYLEQKLNSAYEKVEFIHELSTEIASKIIDDVTEQLSDNGDKLTNGIIKQAADNISLKIRTKPLRKEIAKQVVKSKSRDCE